MSISAAEVNKLRQQTGAGLMDCKKALVEANGDFDAAIDYLRKKGAKIAANRAEREANEGVVIAQTTADGKFGVAVNLCSETDFVAKNENFINFAKRLTDLALSNKVKSVEELYALQLDGVNVADKLQEEVAKIGEKIEVKKFAFLEGEGVVPYIHMGYRMGVLVQVNKPINEAIEAAAKDAAMQIAAMNPISVNKDSIPQDVIERELEIGRDLARQEGKPEEMLDKIAQGKLNKFFKESTLLQQQFVKNSDLTVEAYLKTADKDLTVVAFKRVTLA
jgi:elongation factor Ts